MNFANDNLMDEKMKNFIDQFECSICYLALYNPVSVMPCMHTFCGGCLSDWFKKQKDCPSCRVKATEIKRNLFVNSLVDNFLEVNPEMKRTEIDKKDQESRNIFKQNSVKVDHTSEIR